MSEPLPIGAAAARAPASTSDVRSAIARAAERTGVDFDYLLAQAKLESGFDPGARARTSSAAGLYQFTSGTWLETLDRHGARHGLGWAGDAIDGARLRNPALRAHVMGLRFNADVSALMAAELANDNRAVLSSQLGREPNATELYLAHFLGVGGAGRFLTALAADPAQSAAALLPQAAAANRAIFYEASGAPRSVGGMMELMRGKVAAAMEGNGLAPPLAADGALAWRAPSYWPPDIAPQTEVGEPPERPSMADTLRDTFGLARNDAPAGVRTAYARLRSFGL